MDIETKDGVLAAVASVLAFVMAGLAASHLGYVDFTNAIDAMAHVSLLATLVLGVVGAFISVKKLML